MPIQYMTNGQFAVFAVAIPIFFILLSGAIRRLIATEWQWEHFYLGPDLCLGALSVAVIAGIDPPSHLMGGAPKTSNPIIAMAFHDSLSIAVIASLLTLIPISIVHQQYEKSKGQPKSKAKKFLEWLVMFVFGNLAGIWTMYTVTVLLRH